MFSPALRPSIYFAPAAAFRRLFVLFAAVAVLFAAVFFVVGRVVAAAFCVLALAAGDTVPIAPAGDTLPTVNVSVGVVQT